MKKYIFALICAAMTLVCGCSKDNGSDNEPVIDPVETISWDKLVKAYPFLKGFPVFDGEVENWQYKELGSDMKTVTFFDYKCEESVAKTYYASSFLKGSRRAMALRSIERRLIKPYILSAVVIAAAISH